MNLITNLKNRFKNSPPTYKADYPLQFAFNCGGIDYFEFVDKNNLPYERGLEALTFYQEMQNGVTNDYIKNYNAAMNKLLSDPKKINLNEIIKLQAYFEQRCNYIVSKEIIYKVASVAFVDKNEPLTRYDFKANEKKIKNWKENAGDSFFLSMPIKKLVPFLQKSGDTSLMYLNIVEKIEQIQADTASLQTLGMELQAEKD
jgi:hypothetical protein